MAGRLPPTQVGGQRAIQLLDVDAGFSRIAAQGYDQTEGMDEEELLAADVSKTFTMAPGSSRVVARLMLDPSFTMAKFLNSKLSAADKTAVLGHVLHHHGLAICRPQDTDRVVPMDGDSPLSRAVSALTDALQDSKGLASTLSQLTGTMGRMSDSLMTKLDKSQGKRCELGDSVAQAFVAKASSLELALTNFTKQMGGIFRELRHTGNPRDLSDLREGQTRMENGVQQLQERLDALLEDTIRRRCVRLYGPAVAAEHQQTASDAVSSGAVRGGHSVSDADQQLPMFADRSLTINAGPPQGSHGDGDLTSGHSYRGVSHRQRLEHDEAGLATDQTGRPSVSPSFNAPLLVEPEPTSKEKLHRRRMQDSSLVEEQRFSDAEDDSPVRQDDGIPKLAKYSGDVPWNVFRVQYETYSNLKGWDAEYATLCFSFFLTGPAVTFFYSLPYANKATLPDIFSAMEKQYGRNTSPQALRLKFRRMAQRSDESLRGFAARLREEATHAFPDVPSQFREDSCINQLFMGCENKEAALYCATKQHALLTDAVQALQMFSDNHKAICGSRQLRIFRAAPGDEELHTGTGQDKRVKDPKPAHQGSHSRTPGSKATSTEAAEPPFWDKVSESLNEISSNIAAHDKSLNSISRRSDRPPTEAKDRQAKAERQLQPLDARARQGDTRTASGEGMVLLKRSGSPSPSAGRVVNYFSEMAHGSICVNRTNTEGPRLHNN